MFINSWAEDEYVCVSFCTCWIRQAFSFLTSYLWRMSNKPRDRGDEERSGAATMSQVCGANLEKNVSTRRRVVFLILTSVAQPVCPSTLLLYYEYEWQKPFFLSCLEIIAFAFIIWHYLRMVLSDHILPGGPLWPLNLLLIPIFLGGGLLKRFLGCHVWHVWVEYSLWLVAAHEFSGICPSM